MEKLTQRNALFIGDVYTGSAGGASVLSWERVSVKYTGLVDTRGNKIEGYFYNIAQFRLWGSLKDCKQA